MAIALDVQECDFPVLLAPPAVRPWSHTLPVKSHECPGACCGSLGVLPAFAFNVRVADTKLPAYASWVEYALPSTFDPDARVVKAWSETSSVFASRAVDSDSRALVDTMAGNIAPAFAQDFASIVERKQTRSILLAQEGFEESAARVDDAVECARVFEAFRDVLLRHFTGLSQAFNYYAATGRGGLTLMPAAGFDALLDACGIATAEHTSNLRDTIFRDCARGQDVLRRCDFVEAVYLLAVATECGAPGIGSLARGVAAVCECIGRLVVARHDPNDFRRVRLYSTRVEKVRGYGILRAIFRVRAYGNCSFSFMHLASFLCITCITPGCWCTAHDTGDTGPLEALACYISSVHRRCARCGTCAGHNGTA